MQSSMLMQMYRALLREIVLRKTAVVAAFVVVSFAILGIGFFWPKTYEAQATVFADEQNIIRPLLERQAAITEVDRAQEAKDLLQTRRMAEAIAKRAKIVDGSEDPAKYESIIKRIQTDLKVEGVATGSSRRTTYIKLSYRDNSADRAFRVVGAAVNEFIRETTEAKQRESSSAYQFIDGQVKTYKQQLMDAEARLKQFNSDNQDGTVESTNSQISRLQTEIQTLRLDIDDSKARQASLESQLGRESQYVNVRYRSDVYRERLNEAQNNLDNLLLTYTPTHPDVVNLKHQIEDLKRAIADSQHSTTSTGAVGSESSVNPLYDEMRRTLSDVKLELQSREKRLAASEAMLAQEYERSKRLAARQAELAELTRDYDVTRNMYESLLESKERARISMTLDVEGQGVTYRIQETPVYPTAPIGLRFLHFALAGPLLGLLLPVGLLAAFIQLDPRIRFPSSLEIEGMAPVLAVVPHFNSRFSKRIVRGDMVALGAFALVSMLLYAAICLSRFLGWLG